MAHITKIKAGEPSKKTDKKPPVKEAKPAPAKAEKVKKAKPEKPAKTKKPFILFRPFIALGHYLKESWQEIRQVRWPNRKATWKMVLAVIIYTAIFVAFLVALDALFSLIFNQILG